MRQIKIVPLSIVVIALLCNTALKSQTIYSGFSSPSLGIHYVFSTTGLCVLCAISNPSYAATLSLTDSTNMYMTVGALNSVSIRLKLTDTADLDPGIMLQSNTGLLNASALSAITLNTYKGGVLQETFNGGGLLGISTFGTKQIITGIAAKDFNEIEFRIDNALAAIWDINVFYAFGSKVTPLPVKFLSFNAEGQNNDLAVKWQVLNEDACKGYHIMYSKDGKDYNKMGFIEAKNNQVEINEYVYTNPMPEGQDLYCYIMAEDFNGTTYKSNVIRTHATMQKDNETVNLYPNPVSRNLTLTLGSEEAFIKIYDLFGKAVYSGINIGNSLQLIDLEGLNAGIYFLQIEDNEGNVKIRKFSKS